MNWREHMVVDPNILVGKPVIKGTRLSVDFLLKLLASGWTEQQLFDNYPQLKPEDLRAIFAFVHECLEDESFVYLEKIS
ncbi:MAG: DUF433 domain-containing protein [Gammaproteobacteria bacterium]|nr:DUF433 domain-containing protein [Gammaproteobacteria bacterium]